MNKGRIIVDTFFNISSPKQHYSEMLLSKWERKFELCFSFDYLMLNYLMLVCALCMLNMLLHNGFFFFFPSKD